MIFDFGSLLAQDIDDKRYLVLKLGPSFYLYAQKKEMMGCELSKENVREWEQCSSDML